MEEQRLLIFGTGFIAESYIRYLQSQVNKQLKIKILYNKYRLQFTESYIEHVPFNSEQILSLLESFKPTCILCLHGSSFVPTSIKVRNAMEENALKTMDFFETILLSKSRRTLKKILVVGSASEYGKFYNEAISENFPLHATSLYGLSKISLFNASMYYFERGLPIVHIRQFNTSGPTQRECFVLPAFCKQVAEIEKGIKKPVIKVGDLTQERDFIDIRDTCRAYSLLFAQGKEGEVYNVSSGKYVTIKQLLDLIMEISTLKDGVKVIKDKDLQFEENRLSRRLHADVSKIKKIGFETKYSLRDTIADTLCYWRKHV